MHEAYESAAGLSRCIFEGFRLELNDEGFKDKAYEIYNITIRS